MSVTDVPAPSRHTAAQRITARRMFGLAAAVLAAALLVAAAAFWLSGGRWYVVRTPSMGTAAPVGTLVLTRPTEVSGLHVGDIIAFHPPTDRAETFTHRIVAIADGHVTTRGDINGIADPWKLTGKDIVGEATVVVPGLGWLFRAVPLLAIGGLLVWGLTRLWVASAWRGPARMLGGTLVFALAAVIFKPFINVVQLTNTSDASGGSKISVVSTGLLPVRLTPAHGHGQAQAVDLSRAGRTGVSVLHGGDNGSRYLLDTALHLSGLQWIAVIVICLLPLLWTVLVGYRPVPVPRHAAVPA